MTSHPPSLETQLCIHFHQTCPWVPHFLRVLVRPKTKIDCGLLQQDVYLAGQVYYTPTWQFWHLHAAQCHGGGSTCSLDHHQWLLENYDYVIQRTDLSFYHATREEFARECAWWQVNFRQALKLAQATGGLTDYNSEWPK
jgi:hypothetical protein